MEKQIIHSWVDAEGKNCAIYDDLSLITGSEEKVLQQININTQSFTANGARYFIEDTLSIDRWIYMQGLTISLGFGVEYAEMQQAWRRVLDLGNEMKFTDIVVTAYNMTMGISKIYERVPLILKFCALFMNEQDEDRGIINDDMISKKVEDFRKEGLGIDGFFAFSLAKVSGLAEGYKKATQLASTEIESLQP